MKTTIVVLSVLTLQSTPSTEVLFESRFGGAVEAGVIASSADFDGEARAYAKGFLEKWRHSKCALLTIGASSREMLLAKGHMTTEVDLAYSRRMFEQLRVKPFQVMRLSKIGTKVVIQARNRGGGIERRRVGDLTGPDPLTPFPACQILHLLIKEAPRESRRRSLDAFRLTAYARCSSLSLVDGLKLRSYLAANCRTETITVFIRTDSWFSSDDYPPFPPFVPESQLPEFEKYSERGMAAAASDARGITWWTPDAGSVLIGK